MSMSPVQAALLGPAFCLAVALFTWVCSFFLDDASLADRAWPVAVGGSGLVQMLLASTAPSWRTTIMLVLVTAWALRLGIFITARNWGQGEDRRYREMRKRNDPGFEWKSLYLVFGLQGVIASIVAAPFLAAAFGSRLWGWLDTAGALLAAFGLAFEAIGDAQLERFKADASNQGRVMDRGLWRFTRHPNYFGECCVWWGLWLMAVQGTGWTGAWSVVSPVLMTVLLLKVSGVGLLEKDIAQRRPAYRDYVARTNAFLPGPPRRTSSRKSGIA